VRTIAVEQLVNLLEPYSYCLLLECDGLTKAFSTLLQEHAVEHRVYTGTLAHRESGERIVHMWIEVQTSQGCRLVDYRARSWFGTENTIPHGIFDPVDYAQMLYEGELTELPLLDTHLFAFLTALIAQLLETLRFPRPILYIVGYHHPYAESTLCFLVSRGFPLVDIRGWARSCPPAAYHPTRLAARFAGSYHSIPELGNISQGKPSTPIEFEDLEAGVLKSLRLREEAAAGRGAVYLCDGEQWLLTMFQSEESYILELLKHLELDHEPVVEVRRLKHTFRPGCAFSVLSIVTQAQIPHYIGVPGSFVAKQDERGDSGE